MMMSLLGKEKKNLRWVLFRSSIDYMVFSLRIND